MGSVSNPGRVVLLLAALGLSARGGTTLCGGTAFPQAPVDVTSQLSQVGAGVTVTQVTNNQSNWNTYADVPAYSTLASVVTYNSFGSRNSVAVADSDGTGAQTVSGSQQGVESYVTIDGKFVYYQGQNPNQTGDLYAVPISEAGPCRQNRLSNLNWVPVSPPSALTLSNSSIDPASGKNVIAYSEGAILHRVLDDGTALPDIGLGDPESANIFHRIRLNPVFPNIMWYKRDQPQPNPSGIAMPEIWVVDLNFPDRVYSLTGSVPADHNAWSPDGTQIGYHDQTGTWYVADVLNHDGTFKLNLDGTFTARKIGPPAPFVSAANYCVWAPDGSVFLCTAGGALAGTPIFLMSLDGSMTRYLCATDSTDTIDDGIPKAGFLDMRHIVFSSDRSGTPEVYVISGFNTEFGPVRRPPPGEVRRKLRD